MKALFSFICLILTATGFAQRSDYFQQKVSYVIKAELNPETRMVKGVLTFTYTNQSPDPLDVIWFHLYPNAFKDELTPFARQMREMKRWGFTESRPEDKGWIDATFFHGASKLTAEEKPGAIDEVKVYLPTSLKTGDSITLTIPFDVKIPKVFSRFGTENNHFGMTQWYPKVVVYDRDGWHPDSYLDYGEFYGEFSSFDVTLTFPASFTIDATGMLQDNPSEQARIDSLISRYQTYKALTTDGDRQAFILQFKQDVLKAKEAGGTKSLRYVASMVPDFAWFAGEDFLVDSARTSTGVLSYALIQPANADSWRHAARFASEAVDHYSRMVGPYPYPKASVVDGALDAGGGMEYPMITVISSGNPEGLNLLDQVITHEVGHNWFQSILGSNERAHAWMDEGINSYYEGRTMDAKYGADRSFLSDPSKLGPFSLILRPVGSHELNLHSLNMLVHKNQDLPNNLPASDYIYNANMVVHYQKGALMMAALESYLGREKFDKAMQAYFQTWKFRHPGPDDFIAVVEQSVGEDLNWFFDPWLNSTSYPDFYVISKETIQTAEGFRTDITVGNKGDLFMPVPVQLVTAAGDTLFQTVFPKPEGTISFTHRDQVASVRLNPGNRIYELDFTNNGQGFQINVNFLAAVPSLDAYDINLFPVMDYNTVDGVQLGAGYWGGNLLTGDKLTLVTVYKGLSTGETGYRFFFSDRIPRKLLDYIDWGGTFYDQQGFRKQEVFIRGTAGFRYYESSAELSVGRYLNDDIRYVNPLLIQDVDYQTVNLTLKAKNSTRAYASSFRSTISSSFEVNEGDPLFTRVDAEFGYRFRWESRSYVGFRVYAGSAFGSIPLQEGFFPGGSADPRREAFLIPMKGSVSLLDNLSPGDGLFMPGYAVYGQKGLQVGKAGFAVKLTFQKSGWMFFTDAGQVYKERKNFGSGSLLYDAGLGYQLGPIELLFPVWVSDPPKGDDPTDFRFVLKYNLTDILDQSF